MTDIELNDTVVQARVPRSLLTRALQATGETVSRTIRAGLALLAADVVPADSTPPPPGVGGQSEQAGEQVQTSSPPVCVSGTEDETDKLVEELLR